MSRNPFFFRVIPVKDPFCDRKEELKRFVSNAESNTNVVLYSKRRYGKTSLIKRVQHQLELKGIETIYIDISDCSSCEDVADKIGLSIFSYAQKKESLMQRTIKALKGFRPIFSPDPAGGVNLSVQAVSRKRGIELLRETMDSLNKLLKEEVRQFNIAIDEFQEISTIKGGHEIEALLRKYIQQQSNISYFFLGSRRRLLIHMFTQKDRPFYKSSINCELPPLPKDDAITFIMMRFKDGGKECPFEIAEKITETTHCYPYYVQRLSYAIFEMAGNEEDISETQYTTGLEKMLTEEGILFSSMENALPAGQKALLNAFAIEPTEKPFAISYIRKHRLGSLSNIQNSIKKLENLDYIEKDENGPHKLTDPIFEFWLRKSKDTLLPASSTSIVPEEKPANQTLKQINVQRVFQRGVEEINGYRSEEFTSVKGILPVEKSDKPRFKIFLSYARDDGALKERFFTLIRNRLKTSKKYSFHFDVDTDVLLPGDNWDEKIRQMTRECDLGLLLLSTNFLKSEYISRVELPQLIEKCIPLSLDIIDVRNQDLRGLQEKQIFRYNKKAFSELKEPNLTKFVNDLAAQIEERVSKELKSVSTLQKPESSLDEQFCHFSSQALKKNSESYLPHRHINVSGKKGSVEHQPQQDDGDAITVINYLCEWAERPNTPFFALLGDYGTGKTFTSRMFTRRINEMHNQNPEKTLLCIYIDLRFVSTRKRDNRVPLLSEILDDAIKNAQDHMDKSLVTPDDIIRLVRQGKAMILYDGLDEKTVHFTPEETNEFIRQLWSIRDVVLNPEEDKQGKILISCRTHYFRDVFEQNSLFLGRDREGRTTKEYDSCTIIQFSETQIREYIEKRFSCGEKEIDRLIDLLNKVHNLKDLARKPYSLSLISEFIPEIEKMGNGGRIINTASLYELMVKNWLMRDDGKHEFGVEHKKHVMEALALEIHIREERGMSTEDLESWLDDWLYENPAIQSAYANINRETLKKDLRTATFIIREQEKDFRFAHTSLQEYFLARHIIKELTKRRFTKDDIEGLAMPLPSKETIDFAVMMLEGEKRKGELCRKSMEFVFEGTYHRQASELCLALWQAMFDRDMDTPAPKTIHLEGADLQGWNIEGLDLSNASFEQASLKKTQFTEVQLKASTFKSADLRNAEILNCSMPKADFTDASVQGSAWKKSNLSNTLWKGANTRLVDFVHCDLNKSVGIDSGCHMNIISSQGIKGTLVSEDFRISMFIGHSNMVTSCVLSRDNKTIVSASFDNTLKIWDLETGKCLNTLTGHSNVVTSCALGRDNKTIISASYDNTLKVWDFETGKCLNTLTEHSGGVTSCALGTDNKTTVSASFDNTLKVWDFETGKCLNTLTGHYNTVTSCSLSTDNKSTISASSDKTLKVWDFETGKCLNTLTGHSDEVTSCALSTDNKTIVSTSKDKTLKVWDLETGKCLNTLTGHSDWVTSCALSTDNKTIVSTSKDKALKVWDLETGKCLNTLTGHYNTVTSCSLSADNKTIVSASWDDTLKVWNLETGKHLNTLVGYHTTVTSCSLSANNKTIVSASWDKTLKIWDLEAGKYLKTLTGHYGTVSSCILSTDNKTIISTSWDETLKVWDLKTGKCLNTLTGHSYAVSSCVLSTDNKTIVSTSWDNTLKVWDLETGKCLNTLTGHSDWVNSCALSTDNKTIVSASDDNTLKVWVLETGKCVSTLTEHSNRILYCALSTDNKTIVSASDDNTLKVWDLETGKCLRTLTGHSGAINYCALSTDNRTIVSASVDKTLKIWDLKTGKCLNTLTGHTCPVTSCILSGDSKILLSSSEDGTVKIWNMQTGKFLKTLAHLPENETAAWDGDAKKLLSSSPGAWRWIGLSSGMKRYPIEALKTQA